MSLARGFRSARRAVSLPVALVVLVLVPLVVLLVVTRGVIFVRRVVVDDEILQRGGGALALARGGTSGGGGGTLEQKTVDGGLQLSAEDGVVSNEETHLALNHLHHLTLPHRLEVQGGEQARGGAAHLLQLFLARLRHRETRLERLPRSIVATQPRIRAGRTVGAAGNDGEITRRTRWNFSG